MSSRRRVGSLFETFGSHVALDRLCSQLDALDGKTLVEVLIQLSAGSVELHERSETLANTTSSAHATDPGSRAKSLLGHRLERLIDVDDYSAYPEVREYAQDLEQWLDDVVFTLLPNEPGSARDLIERFLRADQRIIESVDDSDGDAGQAFRLCARRIDRSTAWKLVDER